MTSAPPRERAAHTAVTVTKFLAGRISVDRKGEVGDGISACSTWCIPRVCFGFLRVSSDITPLNNCFPSYFTLLPPTAHNRSTIFERYVSKVACRLPARNMDSPELQERLRLYSKEIAVSCIYWWRGYTVLNRLAGSHLQPMAALSSCTTDATKA